jgi:hypothetical protein
VYTRSSAPRWDGVGAADAVVLPGSLFDQHARGAVGNASQGGEALGDVVCHGANAVDLRVEHLVHGDEMRAHHVPVDVLEGEVEIVEGMQALLEHLDERAGVLHGEARDGVAGGDLGRHGQVSCSRAVCPLPVPVIEGHNHRSLLRTGQPSRLPGLRVKLGT